MSTEFSEDVAEIVMKGDEHVAYYRNALVWLKQHETSVVLSSRADHQHLKTMRDIACDNLNPFVGLCFDSSVPISIWHYASRSSLQDVLLNQTIKLDWYFKYSLIKDLASVGTSLYNNKATALVRVCRICTNRT